MKESDIQTIFKKVNDIQGVFELKLCKEKTPFAFNRLAEHQKESLLAVRSETGFFHKLIDPPIFPGMKTRFNAKRPFDCFYLGGIPAYVVVCWYFPRKLKRFFYITIRAFVREQEQSTRKSLTMQRASEIAEYVKDEKPGPSF